MAHYSWEDSSDSIEKTRIDLVRYSGMYSHESKIFYLDLKDKKVKYDKSSWSYGSSQGVAVEPEDIPKKVVEKLLDIICNNSKDILRNEDEYWRE